MASKNNTVPLKPPRGHFVGKAALRGAERSESVGREPVASLPGVDILPSNVPVPCHRLNHVVSGSPNRNYLL